MDCRWGCSRMLLKIKTAGAAAAILLLAGCGVVDGRGDGRWSAPVAVQDYPVKIGRPSQIGGVTYTPVDAPAYGEVGYASWYGDRKSVVEGTSASVRVDLGGRSIMKKKKR